MADLTTRNWKGKEEKNFFSKIRKTIQRIYRKSHYLIDIIVNKANPNAPPKWPEHIQCGAHNRRQRLLKMADVGEELRTVLFPPLQEVADH